MFVQKLGQFRTLCLQLNITKQNLWRNPSLSDTPKYEQLAAHPINHIHITSPQKNALKFSPPMKASTLAGLEDEFPLKKCPMFFWGQIPTKIMKFSDSTGLDFQQSNGWWPSDHPGLHSALPS